MTTDIPLEQRRFKLAEWGGQDDGTDLLGSPVGYANVYISVSPEINEGHKLPRDLAVGEWTAATFRLSGTKGTFKIVRVE